MRPYSLMKNLKRLILMLNCLSLEKRQSFDKQKNIRLVYNDVDCFVLYHPKNDYVLNIETQKQRNEKQQ